MKKVFLAAALLGVPLAGSTHSPDWPPPTLRDTGLYADWDAKVVGPAKIRFSPQYPLWTDGAVKTRWMELPAGTFKKQGRGRAILPPMPWPVFRNLTDEDLKSIFAYLQTIKPIKNRVPDPVIAEMK